MAPAITIAVTDKQGDRFSALELDPATITIWDHGNGAEITTVTNWRDAAAMLSMLQS